MTKMFSAIAGVSSGVNDQATDSERKEALANIEDIIATCPVGTVLSEKELATVVESLAAIGSDETSVSSDGAFQGKGDISYSVEGAGMGIKVDSKLECRGFLDRNRMLWIADMTLQMDKPDEEIFELAYTFHFVSFGTGVEGDSKVLYNFTYQKSFSNDTLTDQFAKGEPTRVAQFDTTTNSQWGYCIIVTCDISGKNGTLSV